MKLSRKLDFEVLKDSLGETLLAQPKEKNTKYVAAKGVASLDSMRQHHERSFCPG